MQHTPLTRPVALHLEKVAYDIKLDREADDWAPEIISQAYKSMPFLKSYEMDAEFDRVDSSRGYGIGKLLVYPMGMEKEAAIRDEYMIVFPLIVREESLAPFDVFSHNGQLKPMTKEAVERALFRPETFGQPARMGTTTDSSNLSGVTTPPTTGTNRYQGGGIQKGASVLERVAPSVRGEDTATLLTKIANDHTLRVLYAGSEVLEAALLLVGNTKEKTASDIRVHRRASTQPDVVQFIEDGAGYKVKHASARCYRPTESWVDSISVQSQLPADRMEELREKGSLILTVNPTAKPVEMRKEAQAAETLGVYRAQSGGREVVGVVVPKTATLDGQVLDSGVFAGVNAHAMQKVAGSFINDVTLTPCEPSGMGVFVYQRGRAGVATEAVRIDNRISVRDGKEKVASYLATRLSTGQQIRLTPSSGLAGIVKVAEGHYALPDTLVFLPLRGDEISLQESADLIEKTASARIDSDPRTVQVVGDGSTFSLRGINSSLMDGDLLTREEAGFALGALGVPGEHVEGILTKVASVGGVKIPHTRQVIPEEYAQASMTKTAAAQLIDTKGLKVDLSYEIAAMSSPQALGLVKVAQVLNGLGFTKQASVIIDKETVDNVLSLHFITPENVSTYIESLPDLEKTANRLAEILVASRMGMDSVRESAASRAMKSLSDVIEGLTDLRQKVQ